MREFQLCDCDKVTIRRALSLAASTLKDGRSGFTQETIERAERLRDAIDGTDWDVVKDCRS